MIKKVTLVLCLAAAITFCLMHAGVKAYAVEIGQQLVNPEAGWQRFDDQDSRIYYQDDLLWSHIKNAKWQTINSTWSYPLKENSPVVIKFKGSKLRFIGDFNNGTSNKYSGSKRIKVTVDDSKPIYYSEYGKALAEVVVFEIDEKQLDNKREIHTVSIENESVCDDNNVLWFDAIDIDEEGELIDANPSEAVESNRGILTIDMNNGKTYNYNLTMTEINAFDLWYVNRTNGKGDLFYKLTLDNGDIHTMNYNSISGYIVHKFKK